MINNLNNRYFFYFKKALIITLFIIAFITSIYLGMFYIPFIIAYLISKILEPIIIYFDKRFKLKRKTSSVIVLSIVTILIVGVCSFSVYKLIEEAINLLGGLNTYLSKLSNQISKLYTSFIKSQNISISKEIEDVLRSSLSTFINQITNLLTSFLNKIINVLTSLPNMLINIIITILSTYFFCSDKIYLLDRMEHHLSKKFVGKLLINSREIVSNLGSYLKAEIILSFITFIIVLSGLNIFYLIGMNINYPILIAILIGFIDALPILGAGTIMIPWSIILFINSNIYLAFSVLGLYVLILLVKQFIEPKLVSSKIGIHPIFTIISMYTSFKIIGVLGLIIGPIVLIILKNILSKYIEKGIVNSIIDI